MIKASLKTEQRNIEISYYCEGVEYSEADISVKLGTGKHFDGLVSKNIVSRDSVKGSVSFSFVMVMLARCLISERLACFSFLEFPLIQTRRS